MFPGNTSASRFLNSPPRLSVGRFLCGHRLRVSRIPSDHHRPSCRSRGWLREALLPSVGGPVTETEVGAGVEDRLVVERQFEPTGERVAADVAVVRNKDRLEVPCGVGAEVGTGKWLKVEGWPEG